MSDRLVEAALEARKGAHAPYSGFLVGCAVESVDGEVALGANMENACYRLGVCAEQSALAAAQIAFGLEKVARIVVTGGPLDASNDESGDVVTPCGGCRQAILEAASLSGRDIEIVSCDHTGRERAVSTISALLPQGFTFTPA